MQTLRLTCVAGILGAPALSAPLLEVGGAPLGVCLVGPRDSDDALIHRAASFALSAAGVLPLDRGASSGAPMQHDRCPSSP